MVGRGATMEGARSAAYRGAAGVTLEGGRYRADIAARELSELHAGDREQLGHEAG
jgi:phosphoribosylamine-glycine ligase